MSKNKNCGKCFYHREAEPAKCGSIFCKLINSLVTVSQLQSGFDTCAYRIWDTRLDNLAQNLVAEAKAARVPIHSGALTVHLSI